MILRDGIAETGWDLLVQTAVGNSSNILYCGLYLAMACEKDNSDVTIGGPSIRCHH